MSWLMKWITEDEDGAHYLHESWANSWEEVVGHFTSWITSKGEVVKGKVICYWDNKPYGDNNPCLNFDALPFDIDDVDEY